MIPRKGLAMTGMCDFTPPLLFNFFMEGVVRGVKVKVRKHGESMMYGRERKWEVSQLLFVMTQLLLQIVCESCRIYLHNWKGSVRQVNKGKYGKEQSYDKM